MAQQQPQQEWTWFQQGEVSSAIRNCKEVLNSGVFSGAYKLVIDRAAITFLLINLNDLLQKMRSSGARLSFAEDIHPSCNAADITELINNARNAACHLNSGNHLLSSNKLTFNVARGYCPRAMVINDVVIGCDFEDDIAVIFGANRVYVGRHMIRALSEAEAYFRENMPDLHI